ncbi:MAG TPA: tRNA dihydrouridine synthase DusB [Patescibacteria group bacterium]|nr:tRNA dihydrouridine synthase DusB [Patescibacteria group bacterium]
MPFDWNALPRPIIALSPMADMTDGPFCRVVKSVSTPFRTGVESVTPPAGGGVGGGGRIVVIFREMVSAEAVVRGNEKTLGMATIHPEERPLVQQIFGSDPTIMAKAAARIEALHHPDAIDINMGCPANKMTHGFNGAALMREPERAVAIVRAVKAAVSVPVSVKMRLGWSDPTECLSFSKVIEEAGADLLSLHGRTKAQGYTGTADWEMIGRVKHQLSIPVLANGDIRTPELATAALEKTGCDGILIGRAALGNPWIFKQIEDVFAGRSFEPVTVEERIRVIRLHVSYHLERYGERGLLTFRKHLTWYFKGLPFASHLRERLSSLCTKADLETLIAWTLSKK